MWEEEQNEEPVDEFLLEVPVKVTGKGIERFLNNLTRSGLHIWNVKRHGTETITFKMKLNAFRKLGQYERK